MGQRGWVNGGQKYGDTTKRILNSFAGCQSFQVFD